MRAIVRLMSVKLTQWGSLLFPLVLVFLCACDRAREAERLFAAAQEAEKAGQLEVAADLYHRAAGLKPHDFDLHYQAALLYLRAGHFPEAEAPLRKAIALRPDFGPAHLNLGAVLLQQGKKEEGRKESDPPRRAGGWMSGAASKAVTRGW